MKLELKLRVDDGMFHLCEISRFGEILEDRGPYKSNGHFLMLNDKTWMIDEVEIGRFGIEKVREFRPDGNLVTMHNQTGNVDEVEYDPFLDGYVKIKKYYPKLNVS